MVGYLSSYRRLIICQGSLADGNDGWKGTRRLVSIALQETMSRFDPDAKKSFAQLRAGIDKTILLHSWAHTDLCPKCGCQSEILFAEQTSTDERYVEIEDCELCDAILQEVAGDIDRL